GRMKAERYADAVVRTLREPLLVLGSDFRVKASNPAFHELFRMTRAEIRNRPLFDLGGGRWEIRALRSLITDPTPRPEVFEGLEIEHAFPRIGRRVLMLNALRVAPGRARGQLTLLAFEDVTERRRAEEALKASEERFRAVAETAADAIVTADAKGHVVFFN